MSKTLEWQPRSGRKLRVVFVNDRFRCYVDLPTTGGSQRLFEHQLRQSVGGKVSLYRPGSSYRDEITPTLSESNLLTWSEGAKVKPTSAVKHDRESTELPSRVPRRKQVVTVGSTEHIFDTWRAALVS